MAEKIFIPPLKSGAQSKIYARISVRDSISFTLFPYSFPPGRPAPRRQYRASFQSDEKYMVVWVYSASLINVQGLGRADAEIMS